MEMVNRYGRRQERLKSMQAKLERSRQGLREKLKLQGGVVRLTRVRKRLNGFLSGLFLALAPHPISPEFSLA